jgi:hypothetical protein
MGCDAALPLLVVGLGGGRHRGEIVSGRVGRVALMQDAVLLLGSACGLGGCFCAFTSSATLLQEERGAAAR